MGKESNLELFVCAWIRAKKGWTAKMGGINGVPDRVVVMPGRPPFFIEFKSPRGRLSPAQKHMISKVEKAGAKIYVVYSLREFLHEFYNEP